VSDGPGAQSYNTSAVGSLAAGANKSFNKSHQQGTGGFGTSVRRTSEFMSARGTDAPGPGEYAPDVSDPAPASARPSSAFASTTRKGEHHLRKTEAPSSLDYDAHAADGMAAAVTKTFSKKAHGTMGSTRRFAPTRECAPGDYSNAKPGAFSTSTISNKQNTGFGGTASRMTHAAAAAKAAEDNSSSHLSYDGALASTGAFAKATEHTNKASSAFASKSSQRRSIPVSDGPGAQSYNTSAVGSLAAGANKSFNKSHQQGTGGFGTSVRRTSEFMSARGTDAPGPGEYAPDVSDPAPASARPSSAFASTTRKGEHHLRKTEAPSSLDYDAHAADGMAAAVTKTFNKSGAFGSRAARQVGAAAKETPGPGEYAEHDPLRPTCDSRLKSTKGKATGAFASTTLRDSAQWNSNTNGGFSNFLP